MDKREFLEVLRQSLSGEVKPEVIDENIKYYDQYIGVKSVVSEEEILGELGDPRLIAKTIIEADRAAKQKGRFDSNQGNYSKHYEQEDEAENNQKTPKRGGTVFFTSMKWYHKIIMAFIILISIIIIVILGGILIRFLFAFGIPIVIMLLLLTMFRRRR
ncbi:MAG: DUF1700 domain-containing protein [Mobilitalea sp.]